MDWREFIHSDPAILVGKPVIKGTRISVELVLEKVAAGETFAEMLLDYPHLTRIQLEAAIRYALDVVTEHRKLSPAH